MTVQNGNNGQAKGSTPAPVEKQKTGLAQIKEATVDLVQKQVNMFIQNGQLFLPKDYSPENAMKAAWLILQTVEDKDHKKALEVCTKVSTANALLDMVVQGLNPIKKQCYFIVYGNVLTCQRSYFGSMAVAKTVQPRIDDFAFACVYEGDEFEYGIDKGRKTVTKHSQKLANVDKAKILGAYCIALDKNGDPFRTEIMTFDEIKQSWRQSKMNPIDDKGNVKEFSTHGKFTSDMALKTVINKTCKAIINASSDNALLLERINKNEDLADRAEAEAEIEEEANKGKVLEIEAHAAEEEQETADQAKPQPQEERRAAEGGGPGF